MCTIFTVVKSYITVFYYISMWKVACHASVIIEYDSMLADLIINLESELVSFLS